jgi:DNA-binding transcriptional regulator/RsmH inhibitor MraZ
MAETGIKSRRIFTNTIQAVVDGQHRVTMPKIWRLPTDTAETVFYLLPGCDHRIMVLTEEKMNAVFDNLDEVSFASGEDIAGMEDIASRTQPVTLDKQGRFAIDKELLDFAGITDKAVFRGALAYGTITSPQYACVGEKSSPKDSSFSLFVALSKNVSK